MDLLDSKRQRALPEATAERVVPTRSLVVKLAAFIFVLLFVTSSVMSVAGYFVSRSMMRRQIHERLALAAKDRQAMVTAYVRQQHERVALIASRTQLRRLIQQADTRRERDQALEQAIQKILVDAKRTTDEFTEIWVTDADGRQIASTDVTDDSLVSWSEHTDFLSGRRRPHLGVPRYHRPARAYHALLTGPAHNDEGKLIGVIMVRLDVSRLHDIMHNIESLGSTAKVLVARPNGSTVEYLFPSRNGERSVLAERLPAVARMLQTRESAPIKEVPYGDTVVLAKHLPAAYDGGTVGPWGLIVTIDRSEAYQPLKSLGWLLCLLESTLLVVGILTSLSTSRKFLQPVREMTAIAKDIATGDRQARVQNAPPDELGVLARALNTMADELEKERQMLELRVQQRTSELEREVLERNQAEQFAAQQAMKFELLHRVIVHAAEASNLEEVLEPSIRAVCDMTGWSVGHAYVASSERHKLTPARTWFASDPDRFEAFRKATDSQPLAAGDGLAGHVWETGKPAWIEDLRQDSRLACQHAGSQAGLRGAFAFPVRVDGTPVAVLEFFLMEEAKPDSHELSIASAVAEQIGWVIARQRARAELEAAVAEARSASEAKSRFLAMMSHEIRTPMNGILGMTDLLCHTELAPEQREYVEMVQLSADSLLRLLNDILDFSKIEAGKLDLEQIEFSLTDAVGNAAKSLIAKAAVMKNELVCRFSPGLPDRLIGDPTRLRQVVMNLIDNAIKFTDHGEIFVEVTQNESETTNERVEIHVAVRDTGAGIPAEHCQRLFHAFQQADTSTTRKHGGTGLGLAISAQLVQMMDGKMWVESEPGRGSTFHFTMRLPPSPTANENELVADYPSDVRALIMDDHLVMRDVLAEMLATFGIESQSAGTLQEGLELLSDAAAIQREFHVLVVDGELEDAHGASVVEQIREQPAGRSIPIIVVSATGSAGYPSRCENLGIARILTKPVTASELLDALTEVCALGPNEVPSSKDAEESQTAPEMPDCAAQLDVLLVEDGEVNRKVAAGLLQLLGHRSHFATNGEEAIAMWQRHQYDLILMDVHMPTMDGITAVGRIRQLERQTGRHTPIIALTAAAMKGDRERFLAAGMDGYLPKPIDKEALARAIAEHLPITAPASDISQTRLSTASAPCDEARVAGDRHSSSEYDLEVALRRIPGGYDTVLEYIPLVLAECRHHIAELKTALDNRVASDAQRSAHTIKSSADVFGADNVVRIAREIETLAGNDDLATIDTLLPELEQALGRLESSLLRLVTES